MSESIEKDVIVEEDAVKDVKRHLREEIETEKRLGSRFLAKIDDEEAGSTISEVNRKYQGDLMMKSFLQDLNEEAERTQPRA